MREDVRIEIKTATARFTFVSPPARGWSKKQFDTTMPRVVDIFHAANYIKAMEADGLKLPPGALERVERVKRQRLSRLDTNRAATPLEQVIESWWRVLGDAVIDELTVLRVFSAILLSLLLMTNVWHLGEPLFTELRRWLIS